MEIAPLIGLSRHRLSTDGEGVTTLVAFHNCPLRCKYCLNPQSLQPEMIWKYYSCEQLYNEVKVDEIYFLATNGGITFGGGEPGLRHKFINEFRQLCGPDWQLVVETSLNIPRKNMKALLPIIDNYIVDIKDMNDAIYKKYTDKSNKNTIDNLQYLIDNGKVDQIIIRTPFIPSYNTEEDIDHSIALLKEMGLNQFDRFIYRTLIDK